MNALCGANAAAPRPPALRLHPSLSGLYQAKISNLSSALQDPSLKTEALPGLVSAIRMIPDVERQTAITLNL